MKLLATWPMNIKHASQRALEKNPMPKSYCTNEIWRSSQVKSTRLPSQTGSLLNARHVDSDFPFFSFRADHQSTLVAHLNVQPIPSSTKHIGSPPCAVEVAPLRHLRLICCFAVELDIRRAFTSREQVEPCHLLVYVFQIKEWLYMHGGGGDGDEQVVGTARDNLSGTETDLFAARRSRPFLGMDEDTQRG